MKRGEPAVPGSSAACRHAHLVKFYETDALLIGTVADFIVPALREGDAAIVVATPEHCEGFPQR